MEVDLFGVDKEVSLPFDIKWVIPSGNRYKMVLLKQIVMKVLLHTFGMTYRKKWKSIKAKISNIKYVTSN